MNAAEGFVVFFGDADFCHADEADGFVVYDEGGGFDSGASDAVGDPAEVAVSAAVDGFAILDGFSVRDVRDFVFGEFVDFLGNGLFDGSFVGAWCWDFEEHTFGGGE